ncbi:uncharacterized protein LOC124799278 [Schistocerca piceifrons]|uniref:uncharacterized protein LOC124799278 n=1 Tax=Schistocerca piceifrons TaxID=274613 RepID=UPI001F5E9EB1|nr:uncharacterized protein LOC124799278 [Schistocerca piceifrons]
MKRCSDESRRFSPGVWEGRKTKVCDWTRPWSLLEVALRSVSLHLTRSFSSYCRNGCRKKKKSVLLRSVSLRLTRFLRSYCRDVCSEKRKATLLRSLQWPPCQPTEAQHSAPCNSS